MLVSIAIDPACFGPAAVTDVETRIVCERLLRAAAYENAVFLCDSDPRFSNALIEQTIQLSESSTRLGQQLAMLAPDLRKNRAYAMAHMSRVVDGDNLTVLRHVASKLRADAVVCATPQDAQALSDLRNDGIEVCLLSQYLESATERRRLSWLEIVGLEDLDQDDLDSVLGGAVKYCYDIAFFDRYIGPATGSGRVGKALKEIARAINFVCKTWRTVSPYCDDRKASIVIFTEGGNTGADGYIDPDEARRLIKLAITDEDRGNVIGRIKIEVKQEIDNEVFTERLIQTGPRCWQIGHSVKSLSYLLKPPGSRGRVFIGPDGEYLRKVVRETKNLKDA